MKQPLVRRSLAAIAAVALGLTGVVAVTQPAAAATQLVAHYPLSETTGTPRPAPTPAPRPAATTSRRT